MRTASERDLWEKEKKLIKQLIVMAKYVDDIIFLL